MLGNFEGAFTALIGNEGKYSNNPADPGGETMYGITKRVAVKHGYTGAMSELPLDLAKTIAKAEYWDVIYCDDLPDLLDFQIFDACYNSGMSHAIEWLERACQIARGGLSPSTAGANLPRIVAQYITSNAQVLQAVIRFDAYRLLFLDSLPTWPSFGRGWCARIANNLLRAAS